MRKKASLKQVSSDSLTKMIEQLFESKEATRMTFRDICTQLKAQFIQDNLAFDESKILEALNQVCWDSGDYWELN